LKGAREIGDAPAAIQNQKMYFMAIVAAMTMITPMRYVMGAQEVVERLCEVAE